MLPIEAHVSRGPAAASQRKLYIILEQACLEVPGVAAKAFRGLETAIEEEGRTVAKPMHPTTPRFATEIKLQVYIHTARRFSGLMVQLLHKLSIRGMNGPENLLKVIKNPVIDHLTPNTIKISLSGDSPTQRLSKYLPTLPTMHNLAVFVGAMARGRDDFADAYVMRRLVSVNTL
ncbi:Nep1-domain-containing protein [Phlegmacium glaucopus]|nr:Nep1-domain-containing protein [Phlegmacium glaucopus]